jgi:hypothetical protein
MDVTQVNCPTCHRPLPAEAPLCPVCALLGAKEAAVPAGIPPLAEIQAAFPDFEVMECIGRGGMGIVYKARQPHLDRWVALKILAPELSADPGFAERFSREARALAKLSHPNIVAVHDFGQSGGFFWLTMEYVDGVNLRQAMQAARFAPEQALALIPGLCAALQFAHDHGVLHRDIKPENILLDVRGRVKVADFGIARLAGDERPEFTLTMTGSALGSAAYIAPEQIENPRDVDHRADLYSLGVVLYEMLTGGLPLGRFPAPSERSASDPRLDEVVFKALEKERERRFQSAAEVKAGVATAFDRPVPKSKPVLASSPNLVPWSIGLLLGGGTVLGVAAGAESLLVAAPGACSLALGLAAGWWALWRIKKGVQPPSGRPFLLLLTVWLPVFAFAAGMAMLHMDEPLRPFGGKGDLFLNLASVFGGVFAVALTAFQIFSLPVVAGKGRAWGRIAAVVTSVSLIAAALTVAKQKDGRWPLANCLIEVSLHLPEPQGWTEETDRLPSPVERALSEAAGAYRGKIAISPQGTNHRITLMATDHDELRAHWRAFFQRLLVLLPEETLAQRPQLEQEMVFYGERRIREQMGYRASQEMDATTLVLGAAAAVAAAACLVPLGLGVAVISLAAGGVLAWLPVLHVKGSKDELLLTGPPLPPLQRSAAPADFSTRFSTVQTLIRAARNEDARQFTDAFAAGLPTPAQAEALPRLMKIFALCGEMIEISGNDLTLGALVEKAANRTRFGVFQLNLQEGREGWRIGGPGVSKQLDDLLDRDARGDFTPR